MDFGSSNSSNDNEVHLQNHHCYYIIIFLEKNEQKNMMIKNERHMNIMDERVLFC